MTATQKGGIVYFDGQCNLCNGAIQFIIKNDPKAKFRFATLQGARSAEDEDWTTMELHTDNALYTKSTAFLKILKELRFPWPLFGVFLLLPKAWRDALYSYVSANRYKWFGKKEQCMLPDPDTEDRFIS